MSTDPRHERRTGLFRLRMATASLGMAAILGTGALTLTMSAQEDSTTTVESTVAGSTTSTESSTGDAAAGAGPVLEPDASDSEADASSGGS